MIKVSLDIIGGEAPLTLSPDCDIGLSLDGDFVGTASPPYTGAYTFVPQSTTQTVPVSGLRMTQDLEISAIPSNYGLITWDGSTLTVS